jgi:hypothetical protein
MEFYPDASEEIPKDFHPEKGARFRMSFYDDADHAHNLVTRISITEILVMLNNTPIIWISINLWIRTGGFKDCYRTHY